jgi:hypothetical protein
MGFLIDRHPGAFPEQVKFDPHNFNVFLFCEDAIPDAVIDFKRVPTQRSLTSR